MPTLYLIAHLVRGEAAFDIAFRADDMGTAEDLGPWWIVPTSGHRAYPYWFCDMSDILIQTNTPDGVHNMELSEVVPEDPDGHPDHYALSSAPRGQGLITNLAERLGLVKRPIVNRR